jgi:hypothetical protein
MLARICEKAADIIALSYRKFLLPSILPLIQKMLPPEQRSYAKILKVMDIPSDPGSVVMGRLQSVFGMRPLLLKLLKTYKPQDLNMPTLLEVLDSLKGQGVADIDIENFLKTAPSQWKD